MAGFVVDHINGNVYQNTDDNLAVVTMRQNNQNRAVWSNKLPGVSYNAAPKQRKKPYVAMIKINGRSTNLGTFSNEVDAFFRYKEKVEELGEFIQPYVLEKCYKIIDSEMVHI